MNDVKVESKLSGRRKRTIRKGRKVIGKGGEYVKLHSEWKCLGGTHYYVQLLHAKKTKM